MFGLGWIELLVIAGVVSLLAGPTALRKLVAGARQLEKTKRNLSGPGALDRLLGEDATEDEGDEEEQDPPR